MPPKSKTSASSSSSSSSSPSPIDQWRTKNPAQFFSDNQSIAGFDNPGKSLFTTIRELVENSLDAAESIGKLPDIQVSVEKLDTQTFQNLAGITKTKRKDDSIYNKKQQEEEGEEEDNRYNHMEDNDDEYKDKDKEKPKKDKEKSASSASSTYFRIGCRDNGSGMPHDKVPNLLGIVLSSTKFGVKQTRGKFGLGAKMALIWSKKSTNLPIEVWTSQDGVTLSHTILDIDIYKNQPKIIVHEQITNSDHFIGTNIRLVIGGNWTSYGAKVINYMRQLAVITPYSHMKFEYKDSAKPSNKDFILNFNRRTDVMPPPATEMKFHPCSVDNIGVENLIHQHSQDKEKKKKISLKQFLCKDFSSISSPLADKIVKELGDTFTADMDISSLTKHHIQQLVTLFHEISFPPPSPDCLSPAGEYNMRLGIMKELHPDFIATCTSPPSVYEGHPFIIEAAVSIGGTMAKPGITVYRYANRIPLLFEAGNDVTTQVSDKKIRWGQYKIKNTDKIGVFISIVSTKIPFKGTSKEYIGDDKGPLHNAIKTSLMSCCSQLKKTIQSRVDAKSKEDRKKILSKYIQDAARAHYSMLVAMNNKDFGGMVILNNNGDNKGKKAGRVASEALDADTEDNEKHKKRRATSSGEDSSAGALNPLLGFIAPDMSVDSLQSSALSLLSQMNSNELTEELLIERLRHNVEKIDHELALDFATSTGKKGAQKEILFPHPWEQQEGKVKVKFPFFSSLFLAPPVEEGNEQFNLNIKIESQ